MPGVSAANIRPLNSSTPVSNTPKRQSMAPPPPPPPPPPPVAEPSEPDVPQYKALFDFQGQDGELSLKKDDIVELVEKDDNG